MSGEVALNPLKGSKYVPIHRDTLHGAADELEQLRAAAAYCRIMLKQDVYRETVDAILRGEHDQTIRSSDFSPLVQS